MLQHWSLPRQISSRSSHNEGYSRGDEANNPLLAHSDPILSCWVASLLLKIISQQHYEELTIQFSCPRDDPFRLVATFSFRFELIAISSVWLRAVKLLIVAQITRGNFPSSTVFGRQFGMSHELSAWVECGHLTSALLDKKSTTAKSKLMSAH